MTRTAFGITMALTVAACTGTEIPAAPDPGVPVLVIGVLDGDSLVVELDATEVEVRLLGVNTPERDECFDDEARSRTTELASERVRLTGGDEDRFGRLLRYAYAPDGTLINQQLVAEGMALALSIDHPLLADFKAAEAAAFQQRIGLWQADACGPAVSANVTIIGLEADAPGDDRQNRNGEWVEITNDGHETVALDGWLLRDESSSHRFSFPAGTTLAPGDRVRVFSGCGDPSPAHLYWCDPGAVWNNQGDTAYLLDASGNVVDRFAFWLQAGAAIADT